MFNSLPPQVLQNHDQQQRKIRDCIKMYFKFCLKVYEIVTTSINEKTERYEL